MGQLVRRLWSGANHSCVLLENAGVGDDTDGQLGYGGADPAGYVEIE